MLCAPITAGSEFRFPCKITFDVRFMGAGVADFGGGGHIQICLLSGSSRTCCCASPRSCDAHIHTHTHTHLLLRQPPQLRLNDKVVPGRRHVLLVLLRVCVCEGGGGWITGKTGT
jgi:hypothetical protein